MTRRTGQTELITTSLADNAIRPDDSYWDISLIKVFFKANEVRDNPDQCRQNAAKNGCRAGTSNTTSKKVAVKENPGFNSLVYCFTLQRTAHKPKFSIQHLKCSVRKQKAHTFQRLKKKTGLKIRVLSMNTFILRFHAWFHILNFKYKFCSFLRTVYIAISNPNFGK